MKILAEAKDIQRMLMEGDLMAEGKKIEEHWGSMEYIRTNSKQNESKLLWVVNCVKLS